MWQLDRPCLPGAKYAYVQARKWGVLRRGDKHTLRACHIGPLPGTKTGCFRTWQWTFFYAHVCTNGVQERALQSVYTVRCETGVFLGLTIYTLHTPEHLGLPSLARNQQHTNKNQCDKPHSTTAKCEHRGSRLNPARIVAAVSVVSCGGIRCS